MLDSQDPEAEARALKTEAGQAPESPEGPFQGAAPARAGLTRCRAAAFLLSLLAGLLVTFIISFVIPCPDRPASQRVWTLSYNTAVALNFLAVEDLDRDRVRDVLLLYQTSRSSSSTDQSCADEGFSAPCTFAAAVSGARGSTLWDRPVAQDVALVECSVPQPKDSGASSACIIMDTSGSFTAINPFTGQTLWSQPGSLGGNTSILSPLLRVPDGDGDGTPDLLVLTREEEEVSGCIYSGSTGLRIGRRGSLGRGSASGCLLHTTRTGAHYVLFPCASSMCGCSVKRLYEEVTGREHLLSTDPAWESRLPASAPGVPLLSSGAVRHLMHVPGRAGDDLLLVSSEACMLLDGQELTPAWTFHTGQVLRKPSLGHYAPGTVVVAVENGTGVNRQVWLLDLGTGAVLWSQPLPGRPEDPRSTSLLTADQHSVFFFWGLPAGDNQTAAGSARHCLYLFHPALPRVLLQLANVSAHIVAFDVVLLERGRHAAAVLLTGPAGPDAPGLFSVVKHKVKDLVPGGRVLRLGAGGPDSDQAVRDRLSRLRFRAEA
ncbi:protein FAM234A [Tamandua tetradactyla]|uniref:protein FAM234A n=1 Tax=Tamandua tetradactyla TaxID=48850 RepID=UPI0040537C69